VLLSLLPLAMRMAGPREALWHAIIRRNYGATHFIVGRDHAGPGVGAGGRAFYEPYAAQELLRRHAAEIGIEIMTFRRLVYLPDRGAYLPEDEVPPGDTAFSISGTELRERLAEGRDLPVWFTPPEIAAELRRACPPDGTARGGAFAGGLAGARADGVAGGRADGVAGARADGVAGARADGVAGARADGVAGARADGRAGHEPDAGVPEAPACLHPPSLEPERHGG
jgi:hypothetical protein